MAPVLAHLAAELRHRWRPMLAVALLIGISGGLVIGSLAGARRTATAFPRMVDGTAAADVLVNPDMGAFSALDPDALASLPGVARTSVIDGGIGVVIDEHGDFDEAQVFAGRDRTTMVGFDRPRVVEGRLFDPEAVDEVMVGDSVAERLDLAVGDPLTVGTVDPEEIAAWEAGGEQGPVPITERRLTVVGVIIGVDDVVTDEVFDYGMVVATAAFARTHGLEPYYYGIAVDLAGGHDDAAGVAEFRRSVGAMVPGERFEFRTRAATADAVRRGTYPHVVAIAAFALLVGVAATVVCGQLLAGQLEHLRREHDTLAAMGLDRRALRLAAGLRGLLIVVPGIVLALGVAIAISPIFPIGVARRAELDPGISVDYTVLGGGVIVLTSTLLAWALWGGRGRRPVWRSDRAGIVDRVARSTSQPALATGLRAALASSGAPGASSRMALLGTVIAVAVMAAALTFGASLLRLVEEPAAYGWQWDLVVAPPGDDEDGPIIEERLQDRSLFASAVALQADQVQIGPHRVPAVGFDTASSGVHPTLAAGRTPAYAGEVALGGRTMDLLGVGIGDELTVGTGADRRALEIVGQVVFPGIGTYSGADRTELGKGVLLDETTLRQVGEGFRARFIGVEMAAGASVADGVAFLTAGYAESVAEGELEILDRPQRPSDVRSLDSVRRTPEIIALVLGTLATVALAASIMAGVRQRRTELALLRTFGLPRRGIVASVLWQSTVTAVAAVIVGVPLGIVLGRTTWIALAESIGVAARPTVPLSLAVGALAAVVLAYVSGIAPALIAARIRPAVALRAE